jgi:hypothetical protein
MTKVKNAPVKGSKIATLKTAIVNTKKGMAVAVQSNVKGTDIVKAKKQLSALQVAKIGGNNLHKNYVGGFNFILQSFKDRGQIFLNLLNEKHSLSITMEQVSQLKAADLCNLMTDKEKARQVKNGNLWNFWQVETLISRYLKASK